MKKTVASLAVMAALLPTFSAHAEGKSKPENQLQLLMLLVIFKVI